MHLEDLVIALMLRDMCTYEILCVCNSILICECVKSA